MFNLSIYTGHNASFTISRDDQILEVVELERWLNVKNISLTWYLPTTHNPIHAVKEILLYFKIKYGADKYQNLICNPTDLEVLTGGYWSAHGSVLDIFNAKNLIEMGHQEGHAYNAFYQTNLKEATIISFDGGGNDGCFNFYKATRQNGVTLYRTEPDYNIGEKYAQIGFYCDSLSKQDRFQGYLVHSGKLMGLSAYGKILHNKINNFLEYYKGHHSSYEDKYNNYKKLGYPDQLSGQLEVDVVRTSQYAFEQLFEKLSHKDIISSDDKLCLTGGCALNVLNNTQVNKLTKTYVTPNPDDRGLSLGFMLGFLKPSDAFDSTYIGPEVWDRHLLHEYVNKYNATEVDFTKLAEDLVSGKIIGIVRGRSEHGARALGNRSILCMPTVGMKDILNAKVKHREYYRPFAPVTRLEDANTYFDWEGESRWMTFSPKVKPEYRSILPSVTHIDNTARLQTVTEMQNSFLYNLLGEVKRLSGVGVLINTSFNIAGKPILNTYRDAVWMLENVEMDKLVLENYYLSK
jgi:carbamoyltransferase